MQGLRISSILIYVLNSCSLHSEVAVLGVFGKLGPTWSNAVAPAVAECIYRYIDSILIPASKRVDFNGIKISDVINTPAIDESQILK